MPILHERIFRVHGIQNLRVIDASVMPHQTSGNIVAPSQMIGEKGAELVRITHHAERGLNQSKL